MDDDVKGGSRSPTAPEYEWPPPTMSSLAAAAPDRGRGRKEDKVAMGGAQVLLQHY